MKAFASGSLLAQAVEGGVKKAESLAAKSGCAAANARCMNKHKTGGSDGSIGRADSSERLGDRMETDAVVVKASEGRGETVPSDGISEKGFKRRTGTSKPRILRVFDGMWGTRRRRGEV